MLKIVEREWESQKEGGKAPSNAQHSHQPVISRKFAVRKASLSVWPDHMQ
jgi:hypothetical protein